jgi:hypothetical protein
MLTRSGSVRIRGGQIVAGAVQPSAVVPVDPFQGGQFNIVEATVVDQFISVLNRSTRSPPTSNHDAPTTQHQPHHPLPQRSGVPSAIPA